MGGSGLIQKFWGTFCAPTSLEFWVEKRRGRLDQILGGGRVGPGLENAQIKAALFFDCINVPNDSLKYTKLAELIA